MLGNLDPQKMAQVQQVANKVNAEIHVKHEEHEIVLRLIPTTPESLNFVKGFIPQFADTIATQLSSFFMIKGKIINIGKK